MQLPRKYLSNSLLNTPFDKYPFLSWSIPWKVYSEEENKNASQKQVLQSIIFWTGNIKSVMNSKPYEWLGIFLLVDPE